MAEFPNADQSSAAWKLNLFGAFSLETCSGLQVRLPNRKVEALLAILALHPRYGIERAAACEILWPGKAAEAQRANLRHLLLLLKQAMGDGVLEATRSHCRLSPNLQLHCDYHDAEIRNSGEFMVGHEGEWFEQIRLEQDSLSEPAPGPVDHFLETSRWYARHDPAKVFALFRLSPELTKGIDFRELLLVLDMARGAEGCAGWIDYWRGTAEDNLQSCAALLRSALKEAKRTQDLDLASEACFELGKVYARLGEFQKAMKICRTSDAIAQEAKSVRPKKNAMRVKGVLLTQWGYHEQGLELLHRSEELIDNPLDLAVAQSVRAFFEASVGKYEEAGRTIESRSKEAQGAGHRGHDNVSAVTLSMLAIVGQRSGAVPQLERLSAQCQASRSTQMAVYSNELLAKLYLLEGEKSLAANHLRSARKSRSETHMAVTPLEAHRVAMVG
ncbi:MAG TPA: hypothetical protein VG944_13985 [Fimbriimonas sp.]|nr:hypothetical protein [Fimbriimonas sp.]